MSNPGNLQFKSAANAAKFGARVQKLVRIRNPDLYEKNRQVCERHYDEVLSSAMAKLHWKEGELILDHGSSIGCTTRNYLLPMAEKWNSTIIALDNSVSMTEYAAEKYPNERIKYLQGELVSDDCPVAGLKFNKIFSLNTLHWVDDYRKELFALKDVLADDGEIYLIIATQVNMYELFANLKKDEKLGELAKEHLVVPGWLNNVGQEEITLKNTFEEAGFSIQDWQVEERVHKYQEVDEYSDFIFSLNSFAKSLTPEESLDLNNVYRNFFAQTPTKSHDPKTYVQHSPYYLHYVAVNVIAKKA